MAYPLTEVVDLASTLERALDSGSSGLIRIATELGAEAAAVLLAAGSRGEITYFWSSLGEGAPSVHFSIPEPNHCESVKTRSGPVDAESPLAKLLSEWISPHSKSFLLLPWQVRQHVVTVVFCFATPSPPHHQVPDAVMEGLNLIRLATWSTREIARLRTELKTVSERLAGRKLVEQAKGLLQFELGISEGRAYEYMRGLSRKRRITLTRLAEEVIRERAARNPAQLSA